MPFYAKLQTMKRLFIAVNLPEETRNRLAEYQEKYKELPGTWTKKENLHITLQFLGNVSEKELEIITEKIASVGEKHSPFEGMFQSIVYGPTRKRPSMIWVMAEKTPPLILLQKDIRKAVSQMFDLEKSPFTPHLTLARLRQFEFQRLEPEEWPLIEEDISLSFPVRSFDIMESNLKRDGAEYTIVRSLLLGKTQ